MDEVTMEETSENVLDCESCDESLNVNTLNLSSSKLISSFNID